jgi:hypothetical protein
MSMSRAKPEIGFPDRWAIVHEVGAIAVLGMELALVVPWFRSLTIHTQSLATPSALALLLSAALAAMMIGRASQAFRFSDGLRRALLLAALAAFLLGAIRIVLYREVPVGILDLIVASFSSFDSVLTIVPTELVVILAVLYAWRRGVVVASLDVLDAGWTAHRLRLGILACVAFGLIYGAGGAARLLEILPIYFGSGLVGVALSRADGLLRIRGAGRSPFAWEWLAGIVGLVVGTVGLGLAAAQAMASPPAARLAAWVGQRVLDGAEFLLRLASPLILGIATLLERLIAWLIRVTRFNPALIQLRNVVPRVPTPTPEAPASVAWLEPYTGPLQIVGTATLIVLLALVAVRVSRALGRKTPAPWDDHSDALPTQAPRLPALRGILARARSGLEGAGRLGRRLFAAAAIRRIYAHLLALAEARGSRRAPAETPREFMRQLWALFPSRREEIEVITEEYLRVRYGEYPESIEAVARVRQAWSAVVEEARRGEGS